jgi:predicted dinucleotide-binding enzyme
MTMRQLTAITTDRSEDTPQRSRSRRNRLGIALAGDDPDALRTAADLVRDAGLDPLIAGCLNRGQDFEPDSRPL